jgi:MFS family permease
MDITSYWVDCANIDCHRGTVNAFGVFQTYYETNLLQDQSPSNISWIGSIQAFLLLIIGVITGPAYDAGYFRELISLGAFLIPFGLMMTSLCSKYWQIMLAQAICIGLGNGCMFIPSVAILPQYFTTRKALVNGIAASGSSLGGVIYPIVFRQLYPRIGFPWATRVLAFISLVTSLFAVAVMKVRVMPKQKRALLELSAFKEFPYAMFCVAMFFGFIGFYGPVYYLQPYAINTGITNENLGFYLLPVLNAASIAGRILPNFLTDKVGPLNMLIPTSMASGLLALCWIGVHNLPGILIFAILYGFFSGGFVSLPPVALVSLTPDMRTLGTRMGQAFFVASLGLLIGSPVAGEILTKTGSYLGLQLFSGLTVFLTGILLIWTRYAKVGLKFKIKV